MAYDASKTDLAWAAGLFEGEGCFFTNKGRARGLTYAALAMTDEDVVRRFHRVVGVGHVTSRKPQKAHWSSSWCWCASSKHDVALCVMRIKDYLSPRRREQFKLAVRNRKVCHGRL